MNHELLYNFLYDTKKFKEQFQRVLDRTPRERNAGKVDFWIHFFSSVIAIHNTKLNAGSTHVKDIAFSISDALKSKTKILKLAFKVQDNEQDKVILRSISIGEDDNTYENIKYSKGDIQKIKTLFSSRGTKTSINLDTQSQALFLNIKTSHIHLETHNIKTYKTASANFVPVQPLQEMRSGQKSNMLLDNTLDLIAIPEPLESNKATFQDNVQKFFNQLIELYNTNNKKGVLLKSEVSYHGFTYGFLVLLCKEKYAIDTYVEQSAGRGFLDLYFLLRKDTKGDDISNAVKIITEFKGKSSIDAVTDAKNQMYNRAYEQLVGRTTSQTVALVATDFDNDLEKVRVKVKNIEPKQQDFVSWLIGQRQEKLSQDNIKQEIKAIYESTRSDESVGLVILGELLSSNVKKDVFIIKDLPNNQRVSIFVFKNQEQKSVILTSIERKNLDESKYQRTFYEESKEVSIEEEVRDGILHIQEELNINAAKIIYITINPKGNVFESKRSTDFYCLDIKVNDGPLKGSQEPYISQFITRYDIVSNINIDNLILELQSLDLEYTPPRSDSSNIVNQSGALNTLKERLFELKDLIASEKDFQSVLHGLFLHKKNIKVLIEISVGHGRADLVLIFDDDKILAVELKHNKHRISQVTSQESRESQQLQEYIKYLKVLTDMEEVPGIILKYNVQASESQKAITSKSLTSTVLHSSADEGGQSPIKQSRIRSEESHEINVEKTLPEFNIGGASRTIGVHSGVKRKFSIKEIVSNLEDLDKIKKEVKKVRTSDEAGASCSGGHRQKRNIENCVDEEESDDFSYEPLEKDITATKEQIKEAKLYSQIAMMLSKYMGDPNAALDNILTYNRNVGEIINEGELNHSARELKLLQDHYKDTHEFIARYHNLNSDNNLNNRLLQEYRPAVPNQNSWLVDNGSHSLVVISDKNRYKLYSSDFNYRYLFQTKEGTTFAEVMVLAKAFFKWCSGSTKYKIYILFRDDNLVQDAVDLLKDAPILDNPDKFLSDRVLLSRDHHDAIEGILVKTIRELFCIDDKPVDITMLNSDFFRDYGNNIKFRAEELHKVLPFVSEQENTALVAIIKRYNIYADTSYLDKVSIYERPILEDYNNQVMSELKEKDNITSERLSEISWNNIEKELGKYPDISPAYKKQILETSKLIHESYFKNIWIKGQGVAKQALFFLPDIIRAANTGNAESLVQNVGMLGGDAAFNQLYAKLIQEIESTGSVEASRILSKIPITSPIFKFIVMKSIVELHQQLATLPYDSEEYNIIKHQLDEQYATIGVMCAELFGIETGPLWVALMMEQLIYAGEAFRKLHHLHIDRGEAILMSLGFEQDKFEDIMEDRKLVNVNLSMMNQTENALKMQFGYKIVKVPVLGRVEWNKVNEDQVPEVIKNKAKELEKIPDIGTTILVHKIRQVPLEIAEFKKFINLVGSAVLKSNFFEVKGYSSHWEKANYYTTQEDTTIKFASYDSMSCNEVNIFQSEESEKMFQHKLVQPVEDYKYCEARKSGGTFNTEINVPRGLSPKLTYIKIQGGLSAVYVNIKTPLDNTAQRTLCVTFDPREGNLELDLENLSWVIDTLNTRYRPAPSLSNIEKYVFVTHITHKPYPSSIIFPENANSKFSIQTGSNSIISRYYIDVTIQFQVQDKSSITQFIFLPPMNHNTNSTIHNMYIYSSSIDTYKISYAKYSRVIMNGQNVELVESVSNSSIVLEGKREYLELVLSNILIDQNLVLSAQHVKVLGVQGKPYYSQLTLSKDVKTFNLTIAGNIKIYHDIRSELHVLANDKEIKSVLHYSGQFYTDIFVYKLQIENLTPVLDSILTKSSLGGVRFNIMEGIQCSWDTDYGSNLRIESYQDNKYSLVLQSDNASLKVVDSNNQLTRIEVKHYFSKGSLDDGLILKNNGNYNMFNNSSLFNLKQYQELGVSLIFQSDQKYKVLHHFPYKDNITINNIDYTIRKDQIYVRVKEGEIDANKLIKYIQPNGNNSITVPIFINTLLKDTKMSVIEDKLHINNAIFQNLPDNVQIHFKSGQSFSIKELKDTLSPQWDLGDSDYHRSRREVDANSEPVTSSASKGTSFINDSIKWFKNCLIEGASKLFDRTTTSSNNLDSAKFHNFANDKYKQWEVVSKDKVLLQCSSKLDNGNRQTNNILESVKSFDVNDSLHFFILLAGQFFGTNETLVNNSYLSSEQKRQIELNELEQKVLSALEQSEDHFNQSNLDNQPQWYQEWLQENNMLLGTASEV